MLIRILVTLCVFCFLTQSFALELVIGQKRVEPGVIFIFEGAIKDQIFPERLHLAEKNTQVHIEARVNWDETNIPNGGVPGGFIPYLHITSKVINEKTGLSTFIDLLPHLNLIDNFHYARNINLPGKITDSYTVIFTILPPQQLELSYHMDWAKQFGKKLLNEHVFTYNNVDFEDIAKASRH